MRNYSSPALFKKLARKLARKNKRKTLLLISIVSGSIGGIGLLVDQDGFAQQQIQIATSNIGKNSGTPFSGKDPITFQADNVSYDSKTGEVTWQGDVHIWQNDHILRADKVVYNRTTNIATANGNVSMVEPDGEILFTQHVQLGENMREGVMDQVYALLADNGKLAANGARRTGGKVHDFSRSVYTACPICEKDPKKAPFWQLRSYQAIRDMENQRIDFSDTFIDFFGIPVFYMPFFSIVDPSVKRQSGFLIPSINFSGKYMGAYTTIPYYWAMNKWSDLTFNPLFATKTGPQLSAIYRARFNQGMLRVEGGIADDTINHRRRQRELGDYSTHSKDNGAQGYLFLKTEWALNQNWRYGANLNLATSSFYMQDYRINGYGQDTLNSDLYLEGFGEGAYSKVTLQGYQGINHYTVNSSDLPFVLPRYTYNYFGQPDALGGRFSFNTTNFVLYRSNGVSDQRGQASLNWDRPFDTDIGQKWLVTLHVDSNIYNASHLYEQPLYLNDKRGRQFSGQALPTLAVKMNWPFLREFKLGDTTGTQVIEPIVQLIAAPHSKGGRNWNMPNEDSLAYEFSDTTLFALNRFQGTDRLDGGARANVGVHGNWAWDGRQVDFLVGQSYLEHVTKNLPENSGVNRHMSDVVGRLRLSPSQYFSTTGRMRVSPYDGKVTYGEGIFNVGFNHFGINGGYIYEPITPYYYYWGNPFSAQGPSNLFDQKTSELTLGASTDWKNWHASAFGRRSLSRKENVAIGGTAGYRNDCFSMDVIYLKQYTMINGEQNTDTVLFMLTFKTLGTFGING
ncbi:LPS-assembly protein LptD [Commensalibacter papalotli (ex Servin-Garciduenas et al. 2014)]|uniref:LPS-assembly protein LptD n=1 Tax=Commensalibacter papalotli (ex Servin-Garciduenas et al. 2014) TaxID=1208583 RepID=W7DVH3_9PROT|nr:LPS assembly protein LptD [Commensalibacter papalotli (ex Servin-Garciduenas et al. 2014)]EUK18238.1 organic solvent tolerance protein [Commensalibacter papalotli (ex Servin-Garciduenas et al. 2014)]